MVYGHLRGIGNRWHRLQLLGAKTLSKKYCNTAKVVAFFPVMMAFLSAIVYWAMGGFKIQIEPFSILMAALLAITNAHNNLVGLIIMRHCNMSFYSMFLMMGGMFLPFWYGVLLSPVHEAFTVFKAIGLVFLIAGLLLISITKDGKKTSKLGLLLCIAVFIMNGFQSTFSKIHQTYATLGTPALDTEGFIMWTMIITTFLSFGIYLFVVAKERGKTKALQALGELPKETIEEQKMQPKKFGFNQVLQIVLTMIVVGLTVLSGYSNVKAQLTVPASVVFPITTGGSIAIMSLGGVIFYKEKINAKGIIGIVMAIIAVVLFSL